MTLLPPWEAVEDGAGCREDSTQECLGPRVLMCFHPSEGRATESSAGEAPGSRFAALVTEQEKGRP